jgi:lipopolysaccharide transport system ATP-binding protein
MSFDSTALELPTSEPWYAHRAIAVRQLSKAYAVYDQPLDRLKQLLSFGRGCYYRPFWALEDVSFSVNPGDCVGVVGRNGSGKSTLLQIISGVLRPSKGEVAVRGRVAALLELGAGFNPEFTGRENIWLSGSVLGLADDEIAEKEGAIIEFSGIRDYIDQPVKTYSSGMYARLAFSVASSVDPDILIVDEILSVGDARFQARCFQRLHDLKDKQVTILLVTHSAEQVVTHCDKAVLLEKGRVYASGDSVAVVNEYHQLLFPSKTQTAPATAGQKECVSVFNSAVTDVFHTNSLYNPHESRWGDKQAEIIDFAFTDEEGQVKHSAFTGDRVSLFVKVKVNQALQSPIFGVTVKTKEGITVHGSNTELVATDLPEFLPQSVHLLRVGLDLCVGPGDYFVSLGIVTRDPATGDVVPHDRRYDAIHIRVDHTATFYGLCDLKMSFKFESGQVDTYGYVDARAAQ